jgi:tubulin-specific chaperone E
MTEAVDPADSFHIGQRVMVAEEVFGTVAYIGCIPGSKIKWLGVDWDDADRGRHDGTHQGVRYFVSRYPTSGSFVRPNKVTTGVSLLEAIDMRYCRGWEQLQELQKSGLICNTRLPVRSPMNSNVSAFLRDIKESSKEGNSCGTNIVNNTPTPSPILPPERRRPFPSYKFAENTMVSGIDPQDNQFSTSGTSSADSGANNSCGSRGKVQIELVGFSDVITTREDLERQKQILLNGVPLSACTLGEAQRCQEILPNVYELNLSRTLIDEWSTVANICDGFPKLTILSVSDNCFRLPHVVELETVSPGDTATISLDPLKYFTVSQDRYQYITKSAFQNIRKLVAVRMNYSWEQFCSILIWFQRLDHLVLAFNKIQLIPSAVTILPMTLRVLDLAGNLFSTPESTQRTLDALSLLPNLEILYMNECHLTDFTLPLSEGRNEEEQINKKIPLADVQKPLPANVFPRLKTMSVCQNRINSWDTVNQLNRIPHLEELAFMDNPVLTLCNNYDTARQFLVAKMGRIHSLNRSEISKDERRGAELDYLRAFGREWLQAGAPGSPQHEPSDISNGNLPPEVLEKRLAFTQKHPRYEELVKLHGAPEVAELKQFTCALREGLLSVSLRCLGIPESKIIEKKIPSRMTVQHLHSLVRRIFHVPGHQAIRLAYTHYRKPGVEYTLEAPTREVGFYEIENGDGINVHFI